ncbi:hypothetical protein Pan189_13260 [Stratiformator vulcanicus]|uniref:Uncharacterized protein n=1 Tax=Stratiformator vulcanicus TaxID=2527980 RepID=A0A517QZA2_9PLAN|nr:hypothetical protein Pan189_13260 [Stratiformator vulcanicus]
MSSDSPMNSERLMTPMGDTGGLTLSDHLKRSIRGEIARSI